MTHITYLSRSITEKLNKYILYIHVIIIIIHIYIAHYSHCALIQFLKTHSVITLLNTHRPYTEKMKVLKVF